jgi:uncharacterized protein
VDDPRELRVEVDGATLAASYSPAGKTALVALHGASAGERDHPLYQHLHRVLPPAGVGVVTFDRRGEGESTGDRSVGQFELQARDALAVAAALGVERFGLWGYSQGAWAAPIAAGLSDGVSYLALIASTGVTPSAQMMYATEAQLRRAGFGDADVDDALALRRSFEAWVESPAAAEEASLQRALDHARSSPWWDLAFLPESLPDAHGRGEWIAEMSFDPRPVFAAVDVPTLLFFGANDGWTPVAPSIDAWHASRSGELEVNLLPDADHDLTLPNGSRHPRYEERLVDWCSLRLGDRSGTPLSQ